MDRNHTNYSVIIRLDHYTRIVVHDEIVVRNEAKQSNAKPRKDVAVVDGADR